MTDASTPYERVARYFDGNGNKLAVKALRSYYMVEADVPHWTGSLFDRLAATPPLDAFTATDIVAVSMLSVNVPPRAALWLIEGKEANDMLAAIPKDASVWNNPELLDRDGRAWKLSVRIDDQHDIGATIASKILAAKRPTLIPVFDQFVAKALHPGTSQWGFWQAVASDNRVPDLLVKIDEAKALAGVPAYVSRLRVIDVVVWMRQHGRSMHDDDRCKVGCDFHGF